jgi:hypothetical protein
MGNKFPTFLRSYAGRIRVGLGEELVLCALGMPDGLHGR